MVLRGLSGKEFNNIKVIFNMLDTEKDGELQYDEFIEALSKTFQLECVEKEMQKILAYTDMNGDGIIQFTEFMISGCNKRDMLTDYNLKNAFNAMDHDKNGKISKDDYEFIVRGFADDARPFDETEQGKDWA